MPSAEIITIGTEILLGEIVDTNAAFLARTLRDLGINLYRKTTVGDNAVRIAEVIRQAMDRAEIILTTGGLGPTVDDPTREAVALAIGVELEYRPDLWEQVRARFQRFGREPTENNKRQAYIPKGAIAVENPVGTAPSFIIETEKQAIFCLPGVPREMEYLVEHEVTPYLQQRFVLQEVIKARILHTSGVGESLIDERITDLEMLSNPTVGLAAHSGQVDVRIAVKASSPAEADDLLLGVEAELRRRLGDWIYGVDQDTLEDVTLQHLQSKGWSLAVVEARLGGELIRRLANTPSTSFRGGQVLPDRPSSDELLSITRDFRQDRAAEVGLGVVVHPGPEKQEVVFVLVTPDGDTQESRSYGGHPQYAARWARNQALDILRKL